MFDLAIAKNLDLVFTGEHPTLTRDELKAKTEMLGHKVRSSFCSKTRLVVASEAAIEKQTSKVKKAIAAGIEVLSYDEFVNQHISWQ